MFRRGSKFAHDPALRSGPRPRLPPSPRTERSTAHRLALSLLLAGRYGIPIADRPKTLSEFSVDSQRWMNHHELGRRLVSYVYFMCVLCGLLRRGSESGLALERLLRRQPASVSQVAPPWIQHELILCLLTVVDAGDLRLVFKVANVSKGVHALPAHVRLAPRHELPLLELLDVRLPQHAPRLHLG